MIKWKHSKIKLKHYNYVMMKCNINYNNNNNNKNNNNKMMKKNHHFFHNYFVGVMKEKNNNEIKINNKVYIIYKYFNYLS